MRFSNTNCQKKDHTSSRKPLDFQVVASSQELSTAWSPWHFLKSTISCQTPTPIHIKKRKIKKLPSPLPINETCHKTARTTLPKISFSKSVPHYFQIFHPSSPWEAYELTWTQSGYLCNVSGGCIEASSNPSVHQTINPSNHRSVYRSIHRSLGRLIAAGSAETTSRCDAMQCSAMRV